MHWSFILMGINDKMPRLVQAMAWDIGQQLSHYMNQCWPATMYKAIWYLSAFCLKIQLINILHYIFPFYIFGFYHNIFYHSASKALVFISRSLNVSYDSVICQVTDIVQPRFFFFLPSLKIPSSTPIATQPFLPINVELDASILLLTHWGRGKMDAISQTTFSRAFSWMKMFEFRLNCHWSVFLRVQLTIFQHWFR